MSQKPRSMFDFEKRPAGISSLPRESRLGIVRAEQGVFEEGYGDTNYYKLIQRIETPNGIVTRPCYYEGHGTDWSWARGGPALPPEIRLELLARAFVVGVFR